MDEEKTILIRHRCRKKEGISLETIKRKLCKYYKLNPSQWVLDHDVLFCISEDSSSKNLRLITELDSRRIKTIIDDKIVAKLKKEGMIRSLGAFGMELLVPIEQIKVRYLQLRDELNTEKHICCKSWDCDSEIQKMYILQNRYPTIQSRLSTHSILATNAGN